MLSDPKQDRVVIPPFNITDPGSSVQTFNLQFQAPPQIGEYSFLVHIVSDAYMGTDIKQRVVLQVSEASNIQEIEDDISEPDEDSIAGQMQAMKGGGVSAKRRVHTEDSDDSFEESDAEDSDDTDTDTE